MDKQVQELYDSIMVKYDFHSFERHGHKELMLLNFIKSAFEIKILSFCCEISKSSKNDKYVVSLMADGFSTNNCLSCRCPLEFFVIDLSELDMYINLKNKFEKLL